MTPDLSEPELLSFLQQEEQSAKDSTLDAQRKVALNFYFGELFGDEVEGRSSLVTRDVAEVVDYMLVSILRTVVSGDRVVQFEAKSQTDTQAADDASEMIQYQFMRGQSGYQILHDWLKAGLLEKTGIVKSWVERTTKPETLELPVEAFAEGVNGLTVDGMEVLESTRISGGDMVMDEATGSLVMEPDIFRAKILRPQPPKFREAAVPNEEFGVSPDARDLDSAPYLYHVTAKSLSDLRAMGFKFDDDTLWGDNAGDRVVSDARDSQRSGRDNDATRRGPMRRVWLREEYAFYDRNSDGIAERVCVHRVGTTLLSITEVEEQPFEEWTPFPMSSRRVGQSLADKVLDVQLVRSVLLRQGMDSLYLSTNPRTLLNENAISENTVDDLLTVRSGALIRWQGQIPPTPFSVQPVHEQAFTGMEMMAGERESRTGITRLNQGLDADTLNKTATGTALMQAQGQQIEEYLARNFVEALSRLFLKKYRQMRREGQPVEIQVGGQFRQIDPSQWPEDIDIRVRVGLGSGRKDQRIQYLSSLLETQMEGMMQQSPLVTWSNVYNTSKSLIADMAIGNVTDYVTDPAQQQAQGGPSKPSPEEQKAQGEQQLNAAKLQMEQQQAQQRMQFEQQKAAAELQQQQAVSAAKIDLARQEAGAKLELDRQRAEYEAQANTQRMQTETEMALRRMESEERIALYRAQLEHERKIVVTGDDAGLSANRPGGALDQ